jgi:hypothetical protein
MVNNTFGISRVMIRDFGGEGLTPVDILDPNETLTQDHRISLVLSDLKKHARHLRRRKRPIEPVVHMDNSRCHTGQKVVDKIRRNHPPYSPDLSLCDFCLFGVLKNQMKGTAFGQSDAVEDFVCTLWSEVTFDQVQPVSHEWIRRLESICEHHKECVPG